MENQDRSHFGCLNVSPADLLNFDNDESLIHLLLGSVNGGINKPKDRVLHLWASLIMLFWQGAVVQILPPSKRNPPMPLFKALVIGAMTKRYQSIASSRMGPIKADWLEELRSPQPQLFDELLQYSDTANSAVSVSENWNIKDKEYLSCYPILQKLIKKMINGFTVHPELGIQSALERSRTFSKDRFYSLVCVKPAPPAGERVDSSAYTVPVPTITAAAVAAAGSDVRLDVDSSADGISAPFVAQAPEQALVTPDLAPKDQAVASGGSAANIAEAESEHAVTTGGEGVAAGAIDTAAGSQNQCAVDAAARSPLAIRRARSVFTGTQSSGGKAPTRFEYAQKHLAAACSSAESLVADAAHQDEFRWGEYAWLFATCSIRIPAPFTNRIKAVAERCLLNWRLAREAIPSDDASTLHCDDLWARQAAQVLGLANGIDVIPDLDILENWRSSIPAIDLQGDDLADRWLDWLSSGLSVWSTIGLTADQDEDHRSWQYLRKWVRSLVEALVAMKSRMTTSMTLPECQIIAYNIAHVIFALSRYGMLQVAKDDGLYIIKHFLGPMDHVASLLADDIASREGIEDRIEPLMELCFSYHLIGGQAHESVRAILNDLSASDSDIPGLTRGHDGATVWQHMHRAYCCLIGMATWGGLVLESDVSAPCLGQSSRRHHVPNFDIKSYIRAERSRQRKRGQVQNSTGSREASSMPVRRRRMDRRMVTCSSRCFMPERTVSRFAWTQMNSVSAANSDLVPDGIVAMPNFLNHLHCTTNIFGRICQLMEPITGGITVGLWNALNVESTGREYQPHLFADAFDDLVQEILNVIIPGLESKFGRLSLIHDAGDYRRTIYVRLKTPGDYTEEHNDMSFYSTNMPFLNGIVYRCYTVWICLYNTTDRPPLQFRDGSRWHDGPMSVGDAVIFNSCIQHRARSFRTGRRVSIDFRVLIADKTF